MFQKIKKTLYFPVASYFKFWAMIQLKIWNPRIIVVTGSSGKTTLLHLFESQLQHHARYSHKANSSFGIPFDILNIHRETLSILEWPKIFLLAIFGAFKKPYGEKIYVVEADCDRPNEGKFLSELLKPEIVVWLSSDRTHSVNFDHLISERKFRNVEEAIAYEFGYFAENCNRLLVINSDNSNILKQVPRSSVKSLNIGINTLVQYKPGIKTLFKTKKDTYLIDAFLPREFIYSIEAVRTVLDDLDLPFDDKFRHFKIPPGRSSILKGKKSIILIDSSYNANLGSMRAVIDAFDNFEASNKWVVLGDMLEQGSQEKIEHEKLADLILTLSVKRIILMGTRVSKFTYPILKNKINNKVVLVKFETPDKVLDYLNNNLKGHETILFKGARFLEGVIENLLLNKEDVNKLCRREKVWQKRREKWGL